MTANLAFTVKLSIDHLVIDPTNSGIFRLKLPGDAAPLRKLFHSIPWTKVFHQMCFLGAVLSKTIYRAMLKISVLGMFNISVLNFSNDSAKERTIYDLLFIAIYSPKNDTKHPSKMRN